MSNFVQKGIPGVSPDKKFVKGNSNHCYRPKLLHYIKYKLGIGKEQFAKMVRVCPATITQWLYSKSCPSADKMRDVAHILGMTLGEVYDLFEVAE